jgi:hypothetical protein
MRWDFAFGMAFAHFHCLLVRRRLQLVGLQIAGIRGGGRSRIGELVGLLAFRGRAKMCAACAGRVLLLLRFLGDIV